MQFQTENILNDLNSVKTAAALGLTAGSGFGLRNGRFYDVANIVGKKVTRTVATDGVLEKWTIAMPDVATWGSDVYRIVIDVRLTEVRSDYSRYSVYKGKPFYVEFTVPSTANTDDLANASIVKDINNGLKRNGILDLTVAAVAATEGNNGSITVEGTFTSQVFDAVLIQKLVDTTTSSYSSDPNFITVVEGTKTKAAVKAFGSAWFILNNLRIPTTWNTRFESLDSDEKPVDGAKYNQYAFTYAVTRDIHGIGAVGEQVTSQTQHIIYVKSDLATAFEAILSGITGLSIA